MLEQVHMDITLNSENNQRELLELHTSLLATQRALRQSPYALIVLISGVEGVGKNQVINRLNEWLDTRYITTHGFLEETDSELKRPYYWRYWRRLPACGDTAVMLNAWYMKLFHQPLKTQQHAFTMHDALTSIERFEQTLSLNHTKIIKFWLHLSAKELAKRLKKIKKNEPERLSYCELEKKFLANYDATVAHADSLLERSSYEFAPWHLIPADQPKVRDLLVARTLLREMNQLFPTEAIAANHYPHSTTRKPKPAPSVHLQRRQRLEACELDRILKADEYKKQLKEQQQRLGQLAWQAFNQRHSLVLVFEGWDAAGKGGVIRRLTAGLDAKLYRVISTAAPTDEERAHHYLWRFWRHIPRAGYLTLYDRSWYGRVLVERVEQLADENTWQRAYSEINDFEKQLNDHGVGVIKFWLHIDDDEQLKRFQQRQITPWKRHKITAEDWRNREKRPQYTQAVEDLLEKTDNTNAPWHVIAANDKKFARIEVIRIVCAYLEGVTSRKS